MTDNIRVAAAVIAALVLSLMAAACGSSSGGNPSSAPGSRDAPHAGGASASGSTVGFSRCMRSHGLARFPDPVTADGRLPKVSPEGLGVSSSEFNAADSACQHLLPITGGTSMDSAAVERCIVASVCLPAVTQRLQNVELRYARCMRSHGLPTWPDPATNPQGNVYFRVSLAWAASPPEPAHRECQRLTGAPVG